MNKDTSVGQEGTISLSQQENQEKGHFFDQDNCVDLLDQETDLLSDEDDNCLLCLESYLLDL